MTTATTISTKQREPTVLGQTVVLIGGSAGIGLETARRARAEGAELILTGRDPERLEHAAQELGATSRASFDAADPDHLARFFRNVPAPVDHVMSPLDARTTRAWPIWTSGERAARSTSISG
jgi:NADP-dependent 3-hydroxy acid dehydrogenase YdfG